MPRPLQILSHDLQDATTKNVIIILNKPLQKIAFAVALLFHFVIVSITPIRDMSRLSRLAWP